MFCNIYNKKMGSKEILFALLLFVSLISLSFVSAARLPTVGGDDDNWGSVLNDYLNTSLGENATSLNISSGNITLGQKITFALGEMIDNLVYGWIRITGNVEITGDTVIGGSLNVTDDILLNGTSVKNSTFSSIVGYSSSSYDGNFSSGSLIGYVAANSICSSEYPESHFCLKSEVLKTISNNNYSFTGTAWFANGPPGYTANADDCSGWTTNSSTYLGPFWNWDANSGAGKGALTNCAQTKQLMCCGGLV